MKKLIIFDLDGVLVNTKELHFNALNAALSTIDKKYCITMQEHLTVFDGLKTREKLNMLSSLKGLSHDLHEQIWIDKQKTTKLLTENIPQNNKLIKIFKQLNKYGIKVACCSNSIRNTVYTLLARVGIVEYFDLIISNEDVDNSKPHPEMYWKAMSSFGVTPDETVILEDSPVGLLGAKRSGGDIIRIKNVDDLTLDKIHSGLYNKDNIMNNKWQDEKLNVLIPMAGAGSRFEKAGYTFPKPLIEVEGKPMIQLVTENLNLDSKYTYIVQESHNEKYNLKSMLSLISPNCNVVNIDGITEGAACTTLLAEEYINNDNPLIIANSDQYIEWDVNDFMYKMQEQDVDAGILCFNSTHPKWSYAKVDEYGYVTEVAEKNPISNIATVGVYYWKKGSDYVKYAKEMIEKNIRHNNEFYVAPVFNQAIKDCKKIKTHMVEKMWGIGTPEDLDIFLSRDK